MLIILYFSINYSQFSPKISRIFTPLPIFLVDLSEFFALFDKILNKIIEFNGNFSALRGGSIKLEICKIIFRKNYEIFVKSVQFFESFRRKMDFSRKKNVDIFEKLIDLLI